MALGVFYPPCPTCGRIVEDLRIERPDDYQRMDLTRVFVDMTEYFVEPCGHPVGGFKCTTGNTVTEWLTGR